MLITEQDFNEGAIDGKCILRNSSKLIDREMNYNLTYLFLLENILFL